MCIICWNIKPTKNPRGLPCSILPINSSLKARHLRRAKNTKKIYTKILFRTILVLSLPVYFNKIEDLMCKNDITLGN